MAPTDLQNAPQGIVSSPLRNPEIDYESHYSPDSISVIYHLPRYLYSENDHVYNTRLRVTLVSQMCSTC